MVDDERTTSWRNVVTAKNGQYTCFGIANRAIEEQNTPHTLVAPTSPPRSHVDADIAAINIDGFQRPQPVPVHVDGCVAVVERHIASGKLLVTKESAVVTAVKYKIRHEATCDRVSRELKHPRDLRRLLPEANSVAYLSRYP